jgi:hypothetical protein
MDLYSLCRAFMIYIISAAYVPLYNDYVGACVEHTKNDTFLTSNLYSIAYNYASEDGNDNAYNVRMHGFCCCQLMVLSRLTGMPCAYFDQCRGFKTTTLCTPITAARILQALRHNRTMTSCTSPAFYPCRRTMVRVIGSVAIVLHCV